MIRNKIFTLSFLFYSVLALEKDLYLKKTKVPENIGNLEINKLSKLKRTNKWFNSKRFQNVNPTERNYDLKEPEVFDSNTNNKFEFKRLDEIDFSNQENLHTTESSYGSLKEPEVLSSNNNNFEIKRLADIDFVNNERGFKEVDDLNSVATNFDGQNAKNERMEFQVHGHLGPKTYKWGFDTGEGKNRQMRFEEMDANGFLKGHFGYYNKDGKFHMVHYHADPKEGFHVA